MENLENENLDAAVIASSISIDAVVMTIFMTLYIKNPKAEFKYLAMQCIPRALYFGFRGVMFIDTELRNNRYCNLSVPIAVQFWLLNKLMDEMFILNIIKNLYSTKHVIIKFIKVDYRCLYYISILIFIAQSIICSTFGGGHMISGHHCISKLPELVFYEEAIISWVFKMTLTLMVVKGLERYTYWKTMGCIAFISCSTTMICSSLYANIGKRSEVFPMTDNTVKLIGISVLYLAHYQIRGSNNNNNDSDHGTHPKLSGSSRSTLTTLSSMPPSKDTASKPQGYIQMESHIQTTMIMLEGDTF